MPKYTMRGDILPARAELAKRFPNAFIPRGSSLDKRPLKVGIRDDVLAVVKDFPKKVLLLAINDYCSGPKYAHAMTEGAVRVDLAGNPAGVVTAADHAFYKAREAARRERSLAGQHQLRRTPVETEVHP